MKCSLYYKQTDSRVLICCWAFVNDVNPASTRHFVSIQAHSSSTRKQGRVMKPIHTC